MALGGPTFQGETRQQDRVPVHVGHPPAAPGGRKFSEQAPPASFVCALQLLGSRLIWGTCFAA